MAWKLWEGRSTERKNGSRAGRGSQILGMRAPKWMEASYENMSKEAYIRNVIGYRCIRMIAEAAASIPWLLYDGKEEVVEHDVLNMLLAPNRFQAGPEFWEEFYSYLQIAGDSYIEGVELQGKIKEMYALRPDRMKVIPDAKGFPARYDYTVNGNKATEWQVPRTGQVPIMHMKLFHPMDDHYGLSPISAAAFPIDIHNAASGYGKALLDNVARPSGALSTDKDLSDEQFQRLKTEVNDNMMGRDNAGRPAVFEGGIKWVPMSLTPSELDFIQGKRDAAREAALALGVPPMLLGIPGDNTYANYAEAWRAFYRMAVLPLVNKTCGKLTVWLRPSFGPNIRVSYDPDNIEALAPERKELWDRLRFCDFLMVDEKREAAGYEPLPNGIGQVVIIKAASANLEDIDELSKPDPVAPAASGDKPTAIKPKPNN